MSHQLVLHALGLMSGTSLDGLDLCLARFTSGNCFKIEQLGFDTVKMPAALEARIRRNLEPDSSRVDELTLLHAELAEWFANASLEFLAQQNFELHDLDIIGSHGQTLYHLPPGMAELPMSLQLGDGSWLAQRTGVTTVANFRPADMAMGGQGAPLVPFLDRLLLQRPDTGVVLQNIGGMANLSWIGPDGEMMAFDTGPGNALIDGAAAILTGKAYDDGGQLALAGQADEKLLAQWLGHRYFLEPPPRSTGRETFGQVFLEQALSACQAQGLSTADILATFTALTVRSIASAYRAWLPSQPGKVYVSGGGVHNAALMQGLGEALPGTQVCSLAELGWNPDAKEALAFALFACTSLLGVCNNVPEVTGAQRPVVMGQIAPGHNWRNLLAKLAVSL